MNYPASTCILTLLFSTSCATLDITEIENLEREEFQPVMLSPAWEPHNMRLDVIRQSYPLLFGSTNARRKTPYHPLGFDLSNGLFYDMNGNLTLRLDQVMGFSPDSDFEVIVVQRPGKKKGRTMIYKFEQDSLSVTDMRRKNPRYMGHVKVDGDSVKYLHRSLMRYAMVETDTSLVYTGKHRKRNAIYKLDENRYYRDKKKNNTMYELTGRSVLLGNTYVVMLSPDNLSIEIKIHRKKRDKLIYTMVRDENTVFIYKKDYSGLKLERNGDGLDFTLNSKLAVHLEKK